MMNKRVQHNSCQIIRVTSFDNRGVSALHQSDFCSTAFSVAMFVTDDPPESLKNKSTKLFYASYSQIHWCNT